MPELADIRETFEINSNFFSVKCPVCGQNIYARIFDFAVVP